MSSANCRYHALLVFVVVLAGITSGFAQPTSLAAPLKVGVLTDNYPFSYRDDDGRIKGFAYELMQEIEQVMHLKFERIEGTTMEINSEFQAGRIEVVQSFARSPERAATVEFSVPYLPMTGQIFVRKDGLNISNLKGLKGHKVLVHAGSLGERLLSQAGLSNAIVYVDSVAESLKALNRGEGDAALATRLTGLSLANRLKLNNVRVLDVAVPDFEVDYCFAVQKGNYALVNALNEGMAILVRTGKFDALYRKWFGFIAPVGYTAEQILLAVSIGLAAALGVMLWASARQRALHHQIMQQAATLRENKARLVVAQAHAHLGSWEMDLATEKITWSAEMFRLHHCDPASPTPNFTEFLELVHPEDRARLKESRARLPEIVATPDNQYRTNPARGPIRHINATLHIIRDESNTPRKVAGTSLDITRRYLAENAMRAAIRRLEFIAQMTNTVIGTNTTAEVAQRLAVQAKACFEVDACVIRMLEADQLVLLGAHGIPEGEMPEKMPVFGLAKEIIANQRALIISDVRVHPLTQKLAYPKPGGFNFISYAGVPLLAENQIVGILGIYTTFSPRTYSDQDVEHLQIIANQAAISLSNERLFKTVATQKAQLEITLAEQARTEAKLRDSSRQLRALSARLETLREEERVRISREIHDELGQKLTGLKMDLYWVENRLASITEENLRAALENKIVAATAAADETMVTVQRIAAELRPAMLDNLGLIPALRFETNQFQARTTIPVNLTLPITPIQVSGEIATTVYRIYQEVLTNVTRHAHASQVEVTLTSAGGSLSLRVQDNGVGVSAEDLAQPTSLGLLGMQERAAMVNGKLSMSGAPGAGTLVLLEISIETGPR